MSLENSRSVKFAVAFQIYLVYVEFDDCPDWLVDLCGEDDPGTVDRLPIDEDASPVGRPVGSYYDLSRRHRVYDVMAEVVGASS